jgi:hypothetical protein
MAIFFTLLRLLIFLKFLKKMAAQLFQVILILSVAFVNEEVGNSMRTYFRSAKLNSNEKIYYDCCKSELNLNLIIISSVQKNAPICESELFVNYRKGCYVYSPILRSSAFKNGYNSEGRFLLKN